MPLRIGDIKIGKIDGKYEFVESLDDSSDFFDSFLIPKNANPSEFGPEGIWFVHGMRGTGKTSLLRYVLFKELDAEDSNIILFKTDLPEYKRLSMSNNLGVQWLETDSGKMEVAQDFKELWRWFILHKIAETISAKKLSSHSEYLTRFLKLMGISGGAPFEKILGVFPKLKGANVQIQADLEFFKAELGVDFEGAGSVGSASLSSINDAAQKILCELKINKRINIGFDELEVFLYRRSSIIAICAWFEI